MRSSTSIVALAAGVSAVSAQALQGFNYGATNSDGSLKDQQRFADEFKVAKSLVGTSGWASARLYTSIQGGTTNGPIAAIPAAIAEDTTILLGIWCSAGQEQVNNEIAAIKNAIAQYGDEFTSRVTGLSVGSEDLYRISPTGVAADSGYGAGPDELVKYIGQVRDALVGTPLENVKIGHVDTWNDWVNGSNSAVVDAVDWLGFDGYPYFQSTVANSIDNSEALFDESYAATVAAAKGKDVWVTETGWPVSGPTYRDAVPSLENARKYWEKVACKLIGKVNTYWYTLQDAYPVVPAPSFGVVGTELSTTPLYDLSCPADGGSSSSSSAAGTSTSNPISIETETTAGSGGLPTATVSDIVVTSRDVSSTAYGTGVVPVPTGGPSGGPAGGSNGGNSTLIAPTGGPSGGPGVSGGPTNPAGPSNTVSPPPASSSAFVGGAASTAAPVLAAALGGVMAIMAAF